MFLKHSVFLNKKVTQFFFRGTKLLNLEIPKTSYVAKKGKGFEIFFEVTYPSGWAPQLANGTIQNGDPIPANSYCDVSVPSSGNLSLTFYCNAIGGEVKI
jgi:hypothetical protein